MTSTILFLRCTTLLILLIFNVPHTVYAETKVGDRFGDWLFECTALAEDKTACALTQTIVSQKNNRRIVKFNLAHNEKNGGVMLTALLPLAIHLPSGVSGAIDQGKAFTFTLQTCLPHGCIATYPVDGSFLKSMQNGKKLSISFTAYGKTQPAHITGSLEGLAAGLKAADIK